MRPRRRRSASALPAEDRAAQKQHKRLAVERDEVARWEALEAELGALATATAAG